MDRLTFASRSHPSLLTLASVVIALAVIAARMPGHWLIVLSLVFMGAVRWRYMEETEGRASRLLATDEALMRSYANWEESDWPAPTLRIHTFRSHSALVGRYQSVDTEVNTDECERLGISVNRRITGAGAVLVGSRQVVLTLHGSTDDPVVPAHPARIMGKLARGVATGLRALGLNAEFRPRHDIAVGGRRIGSSVLCIGEDGSFLYAASLLVDLDVPLLIQALRLPSCATHAKTVRFYEDRFTAVARELRRDLEVGAVMQALRSGFEAEFRATTQQQGMTEDEEGRVAELEHTRYTDPAWIRLYETSRDAQGTAEVSVPTGTIRVLAAVSGSVLNRVMITGYSASSKPLMRDIEAALALGRSDKAIVRRIVMRVAAGREAEIEGIDARTLADVVSCAVDGARSRLSQAADGSD